jgi:hypothetical membrane protein
MRPGVPSSLRRAAVGGVVGPVVFVSSWAVLGSFKDGYSQLHDPISELAAVHASTRVVMTGAFVVFAGGLTLYATALRHALDGPAWIAALTTGVATLGVAVCPLHHSSTVDTLHGVFAGTGYVTLAATALLSVRPLARRGRRGWARGAALSGGVSGLALALTLTGSFGGLFQKFGLTAGDVFVVASAAAISAGTFG